ncbi:MAG: hypothetical protein IKE70_01050 [Bacilli bacterium]|nr:hypothetical protein [Bacilli bacterium]
MNNRYFYFVILLIFSMIFFTGCDSKKEKKESISLEKGAITVTCRSNNLGDSVIKMKSTVISNFDKNQVIMNYSVETVEEHEDTKSFQERKKIYDETYKEMKDTEEYSYIYKVDEEKRIFTMISLVKNIDISEYGEEERKTYELKNYIKNYEDGAYHCSLDGITRKELGLK